MYCMPVCVLSNVLYACVCAVECTVCLCVCCRMYCMPVCVLSNVLYACVCAVECTVCLCVCCRMYCMPVCVLSNVLYACVCVVECTVCLCVCRRMYCILHVGVLYCMSNKEVTFVCRCTRGWAQCGVNCVGTSCGDCGLKAISAQVRGRGCAGGWVGWGEVRVTFHVDRDSTSTVSNAISAHLAS